MFIVIPLRTDAAIDHRPWGTAALIAANVLVALLLGFPVETDPELAWEGCAAEEVAEPFVNSWVLEYGKFNPITWVTSIFVHDGYLHLIFNMVFLWTFGLVVEGAIGWRKFVPLYLAIGTVQCGSEQLLMLGADGGWSIGASAAIYGIMAIAALWSPKNRLTLFVWILVVMRKPEVTVLGFCAFWIGTDLLYLLFRGINMSTEFLHLSGAVVGLAAGVSMMRKGWVDTGGWDYLSLRAKREAAANRPRGPAPASRELEVIEMRDNCARVIAGIEEGNGPAADEVYTRVQQATGTDKLSRADLLRLTELLLRSGTTGRGIERMEEFVRLFPEGCEAVRLTLADHLVRDRRPSRALEHLGKLADNRLSDAQRKAKADLEAHARAGLEKGGLEFE